MKDGSGDISTDNDIAESGRARHCARCVYLNLVVAYLGVVNQEIGTETSASVLLPCCGPCGEFCMENYSARDRVLVLTARVSLKALAGDEEVKLSHLVTTQTALETIISHQYRLSYL